MKFMAIIATNFLRRHTTTLIIVVFFGLSMSAIQARPKRDTNQNRTILSLSEQSPPPEFFTKLGAKLTTVGYHVNSTMLRGWIASTICPNRWPDKRHQSPKAWSKIRKKKRDCGALVRSYKTATIRDEKFKGSTVAQELHLWIYKSPKAARRAVANMDDMTLRKRPYRTWRRGEQVLVLEQRWRFKRFGIELENYINDQLKDNGWSAK